MCASKQGKNYLDIDVAKGYEPRVATVNGSGGPLVGWAVEQQPGGLHQGFSTQFLLRQRQSVADGLGRPAKPVRDLVTSKATRPKFKNSPLKRSQSFSLDPLDRSEPFGLNVRLEAPWCHFLTPVSACLSRP